MSPIRKETKSDSNGGADRAPIKDENLHGAGAYMATATKGGGRMIGLAAKEKSGNRTDNPLLCVPREIAYVIAFRVEERALEAPEIAVESDRNAPRDIVAACVDFF